MTVTMSVRRSRRQACIWLVRFGVVGLSYWFAWLLRFDFAIPRSQRELLLEGLFIALLAKGLAFTFIRPRLNPLSRFTGYADLVRLLQHNLVASAVATIAIFTLLHPEFPRSVYLLDFIVCFLASGFVQFGARVLHETQMARMTNGNDHGLLIYGAGVAGVALAREIRINPRLGYRLVGFLDDDPVKRGLTLLGAPVLGSGDDARRIVSGHHQSHPPIKEIAVCMPSAAGRQIRAALDKAEATGLPCRIVPGLGELISGKIRVNKFRDVSVTDLLGREGVHLNQDEVRRAITGRVVLVTGAAGSIGSELCNQIAGFTPLRLIAVDQAESEVFRLDGDLRERYPQLSLVTNVADIRDARRVERILEEYGVDSIFHAAAYKHVPVMERQVCEAVRNNVIATWNLAQAAWRQNVSRFLLISTDKAVNPSSVMGLTKRIAELIVSAERPVVGHGNPTRFVCVRFGNVLVSNGSVVPIFQKQIARGGPVTVTHPDIRRYFMTIQEAVQLVLQASSMGKGSEIFVLDMGKPVRVIELARKMITLAGLIPDEDIEIRFVGLRPGEKLFEEISLGSEHHLPTDNPKIRVFQGRRVSFSDLAPWISEVQHLLWRNDAEALISHMSQLVPEYKPEPHTAVQAALVSSAVPRKPAASMAFVEKLRPASELNA